MGNSYSGSAAKFERLSLNCSLGIEMQLCWESGSSRLSLVPRRIVRGLYGLCKDFNNLIHVFGLG